MPLDLAVLDFQTLGVVETADGDRARASCLWRRAATWSIGCSRPLARPACGRRASISPPSR